MLFTKPILVHHIFVMYEIEIIWQVQRTAVHTTDVDVSFFSLAPANHYVNNSILLTIKIQVKSTQSYLLEMLHIKSTFSFKFKCWCQHIFRFHLNWIIAEVKTCHCSGFSRVFRLLFSCYYHTHLKTVVRLVFAPQTTHFNRGILKNNRTEEDIEIVFTQRAVIRDTYAASAARNESRIGEN